MGESDGYTILVIDDEKIQRHMVVGFLEKQGHTVLQAADGPEGIGIVRERQVDIVLTDYKMPKMTGIEALEEIKKINPNVQVLVITAYGTVDTAVQAMKKGASDFITKPINLEALALTIGKITDRTRLVRENERLRRRLQEYETAPHIVGRSIQMQEVLETARRVAPSDTSVLITGETGTGKEMVASLVHHLSRRVDQPFVKVNCGAIPRDLIESELFGHMKGSFTGAIKDKSGVFAEADRGTILLDEVGELTPAAQVKLLRVLQDHEVHPIGSTRAVKTDIRVVAATNRDVRTLIKEGSFREDLYFRLNVVPVHIPPLRERREDIPALLDHFLVEICKRLDSPAKTFSTKALDVLMKYAWPGNVREMRNLVERMVLLSRTNVIDTEDLPVEVKFEALPSETRPLEEGIDLNHEIERLERSYIEKALDFYKGNQSLAARALGLSERVIRYKMNKYGLK
jgi:two-component system NtrC family response regulator